MAEPLPTEDVAQLAALHARCFPKPWSENDLRAMLAVPGTVALMIPGAAMCIARAVEGEGEIMTIGVVPGQREKGLGKTLLAAALSALEEMGASETFLEVGVENHAAERLYRGAGFEQVGYRADYYAREGGRREDARVMRRKYYKK